jgi:predicted RNase H-like HicB family nuclease
MRFTLSYWLDENWYVGKLLEVPGVFSQGETLEELKENIKEAYQLMIDDYNESTQYQPNTNSLELVI